MTSINTLKKKLKTRPKTFNYRDVKRVLEHEGYYAETSGKTSGSRVRFINKNGSTIVMHKPHPASDIKSYAVNGIVSFLEKEGKL